MKKEILKIVDWLLIQKVLSGTANKVENDSFQQWLAFKNNEKLFMKIKTIWNNNYKESSVLQVDTEKALLNVKNRILDQIKEEERPSLLNLTILKVAASLVIVFSIIFLLIDNAVTESGNPTIVKTDSKNQRMVELADGSKVYLNRNSKLVYNENFNKDSRAVQLFGEAFFEISRNPQKPFIVHTRDTKTKVLGTSFNIKINEFDDVGLVVESGEVSFETLDENEKVLLRRGDKAEYIKNDDSLYKSKNQDPNFNSWKTQILAFQEKNLEDVFETIEEVFLIKIEVENGKINDCKLSARFNKQSLESILNAIGATFDISITKVGNKYLLNGEGC